MPDDVPADDPIAEEAVRARTDPDRTMLPSTDGLGPGAGETPAADVSAGTSTRQDEDPTVTSTPSIRGVPRSVERPDFRSSQLDGAPKEKNPDGGD